MKPFSNAPRTELRSRAPLSMSLSRATWRPTPETTRVEGRPWKPSWICLARQEVGAVDAVGRETSCMPDRVFLDTNVFVYLYDSDNPDKQARARALLDSLSLSGTLFV